MTNGNYDWDAFINIEVLQGSSNRHDQERLTILLNNLASSNGWKLCASFLLRESSFVNLYKNSSGLGLKDFFCFRGIEEYINKYEHKECEQQLQMFIIKYFEYFVNEGSGFEKYMRNKFVHIITKVGYIDYPRRWPSLFKELIFVVQSSNTSLSIKEDSQISSSGERAFELFFKFLVYWFNEICAREKQTTDLLEKNTSIKDYMREHDIYQIMELVQFVIVNINIKKPKLLKSALEVTAVYISWIDIQFVVSENMIESIIRPLMNECGDSVKSASLNCLLGIIGKGMIAEHKFQLISFLDDKLTYNGLYTDGLKAAARVIDDGSYGCDDADNCFYVTFGSLINEIALQLIDSYKSLREAKNDIFNACMNLLYQKIKLAIEVVCCPNNEIAATCLESVQSFVSLLTSIYKCDAKKTRRSNGSRTIPMTVAQLNDDETNLFKQLIMGLYHKLQYPSWYNFDNEDEREGDFQEFRKHLLTILTNMIKLNYPTVLNYLLELVKYTLEKLSTLPFQAVETALIMIYRVGEAVKSVKGDYFCNECEVSRQLSMIMTELLSSDIGKYNNCEVRIMYFEILFRYEKFFNHHSEYLSETITLFLSEYGLKSNELRLVPRCVNILSRLIKSHKNKLGNIGLNVLSEISNILQSSFINNSILETDNLSTISAYSYLFESASQLIICSNIDDKPNILLNFVQPITAQLPYLCEQWINASLMAVPTKDTIINSGNGYNVKARKFSESIYSAATYINYLCRAFSGSVSMNQLNCLGVFLEAVDKFLSNIQYAFSKSQHPRAVGRDKINSGLRSLIHIMVKSSQSDETAMNAILERLPLTIKLLSSHFSLTTTEGFLVVCNELSDIIPLYMQILNGFKQNSFEFLKVSLWDLFDLINNTITKSCSIDLSNLEEIATKQEIIEKLRELCKLNFQLFSCEMPLILSALTSNQVIQLFSNAVDMVQRVSGQITNRCNEQARISNSRSEFDDNNNLLLLLHLDPVIIKSCISVFQKFINLYPTLTAIEAEVKEIVLHQCIYRRLLPFLITLPSFDLFNVQDAQFCLTLSDIANFQRSLYINGGSDFIEFLRTQCLPQLTDNNDLIEKFCSAIVLSDKDYQTFLKNIYVQFRVR